MQVVGLVPRVGDALLCVKEPMKAGIDHHKDSPLASNKWEELVVKEAAEALSVVGAKQDLTMREADRAQSGRG